MMATGGTSVEVDQRATRTAGPSRIANGAGTLRLSMKNQTFLSVLGGSALLSQLWAAPIGSTEAGLEAPTLEFQGEVRSEAYEPQTGKAIQSVSYEYTIYVTGEKWRVRTLDNQAALGARKNAEHMEISFDGRDLYGLVHFSQPVLTEYKAKDKADYPAEFGQVHEGDFPVTADPIQKMLWLAYCSQSYLSNLGGKPMPSLVDLTFSKEAPKVQVSYEQFSGKGSLPKQLNEYAPGKRLALVNGTLAYAPCPPPFDKEYLAMHYEVTEATNYSGALFPVRFRAEYFMPVEHPGSACSNCLVRVQEGFLRSIQAATVSDLRPRITAEAVVRDARFPEYSKAPVLAYREAQASWLDRNSPTLSNDIAAKPRLRPIPTSRPVLKGLLRWAFLAMLGGLLIAPVFLVIRQRRNNNSE
jgi:hypothetical protein